jgi:hypothetical protein
MAVSRQNMGLGENPTPTINILHQLPTLRLLNWTRRASKILQDRGDYGNAAPWKRTIGVSLRKKHDGILGYWEQVVNKRTGEEVFGGHGKQDGLQTIIQAKVRWTLVMDRIQSNDPRCGEEE